jgi:hypothetical protein
MSERKPTYHTFRLYLRQPLRLYFQNYIRLVREERFHGRLSVNFLIWSVLATANLIDTLVTYYVFANGGVEVNPAMAFLCTKFGNISLAFYKGILLGVLLIFLPLIKGFYQKLLAFTTVVYIILVFSHMLRF